MGGKERERAPHRHRERSVRGREVREGDIEGHRHRGENGERES